MATTCNMKDDAMSSLSSDSSGASSPAKVKASLASYLLTRQKTVHRVRAELEDRSEKATKAVDAMSRTLRNKMNDLSKAMKEEIKARKRVRLEALEDVLAQLHQIHMEWTDLKLGKYG